MYVIQRIAGKQNILNKYTWGKVGVGVCEYDWENTPELKTLEWVILNPNYLI